MPKKIQRDQKKSIIHAKHLDKFGEIVKRQRSYVPCLRHTACALELTWDFSDRASEEQVFMLRSPRGEHYISKQALEHVTRAI